MNDLQLKELIERLRGGENEAFEELYRALSVPIFTMILRITGDRMLAEDILQEFFVKLYHDLPDGKIVKTRAYIYRSARNLALDALRKQKTTEPLKDNEPALGEDLEVRMDIGRAMARLVPIDRDIVVMHINGGLKFREIAAITEKPLGTVLWRYRRALGELRGYLEGGMS